MPDVSGQDSLTQPRWGSGDVRVPRPLAGRRTTVASASSPAAHRLRNELPVPSSPFGRDVLVNVVANLVAGAVIYLVGAALGLFPVVGTAVVVLLGTLPTAWPVVRGARLMARGHAREALLGLVPAAAFGAAIITFSDLIAAGLASAVQAAARVLGGLGVIQWAAVAFVVGVVGFPWLRYWWLGARKVSGEPQQPTEVELEAVVERLSRELVRLSAQIDRLSAERSGQSDDGGADGGRSSTRNSAGRRNAPAGRRRS
jgi:hypothetical protein